MGQAPISPTALGDSCDTCEVEDRLLAFVKIKASTVALDRQHGWRAISALTPLPTPAKIMDAHDGFAGRIGRPLGSEMVKAEEGV